MTDPKQALYDFLSEAFKAGQAYQESEFVGRQTSAASVLFPLAARMEEVLGKLIEEEREACAMVAVERMCVWKEGCNAWIACRETAFFIRERSLPSSPERET
jgi:hypothetical protein